tara:strand:+ start:1114 stop:2115 length:1002 start_codon:yes stop_codon:yes gene_type:complete
MTQKKVELKRVLMEVFGGCNYTCQMCPQSTPGRDTSFKRKLPLKDFEKILDKITPEYGKPVIGLSGSGEATMAKDLADYIKIVKKRNLSVFIYTNGARVVGDYMKSLVDAGIDLIRFSIIGYNQEVYKKWMNSDNFDLVLKNAKEANDYIKKSNSNCKISTYHLITDNNKIDMEKEKYQKIIKDLDCYGYIWKMHNMSGNYANSENPRNAKEKVSCGRPFAPELTVRAGGEPGRLGAVTACCQTLGPPNESKSIMGHLDTESFEEVYFGKRYENLRRVHKEKKFDELDYCKDCDFLFNEPESLVWTNDKDYKLGQMLGVSKDFNLVEYGKVGA